MVEITLLCSNSEHPIYPYLEKWKETNASRFEIKLVNRVSELDTGGDILFLISCSEIVKEETMSMYCNTLVLHASDLPEGRGWSPHVWDIISGKKEITLSLLEAKEPVDTGAIWRKLNIPLTGTELFDEINELLFQAELSLIEWACINYKSCLPLEQSEISTSYHRKRTPLDSEVNMDSSLRSQFNLLRICDPNRFPAFFYVDGKKFKIRIERDED